MSYFEREARAQFAQGVAIADIAAALSVDQARIELALRGENVVRVVQVNDALSVCDFIDCLAAAGMIQMHRKSENTMCFDILPPWKVKDTMQWACLLAKNLEAKGFNAVQAPRWPDEA
jgi:hypothetical protein